VKSRISPAPSVSFERRAQSAPSPLLMPPNVKNLWRCVNTLRNPSATDASKDFSFEIMLLSGSENEKRIFDAAQYIGCLVCGASGGLRFLSIIGFRKRGG